MRAILTNFGSTGDVQPLLALAAELSTHGHQPVLCLSPHYRKIIEQLGFQFIPVGPEIDHREIQRRELSIRIKSVDPATERNSNFTEEMQESLSLFASMLPQVFEQLRDASGGADLLISGHLQPAARMIHELTGIPFVSVQVNEFGGKGVAAEREAIASIVNPFRARLGLPPVQYPLTRDANSPQLALYAMSRHISPPPPNWPPHYHMTGYFFLEEGKWHPDTSLIEFINYGKLPVVITFGSMAHGDPVAITGLILEAVERAGRHAIVQRGWSGLAEGEVPPNVRTVGFVPYGWLFPRAACVVHHGGTGTAAWAFRSGVPSVFVPHVRDQYMWAEYATDMRCAGPSIPYPDLTSVKLADAILKTLANEVFYANSAALGEKIRAERGVEIARILIEKLVYQGTSLPIEDFNGQQVCEDERHVRARRRKQYQQKQRAIRSRDS
jgi:sterol 3beta-glucosyltransferase